MQDPPDLEWSNPSRTKNTLVLSQSQMHLNHKHYTWLQHVTDERVRQGQNLEALMVDMSSKGMLKESSNGHKPVKVCMKKDGCNTNELVVSYLYVCMICIVWNWSEIKGTWSPIFRYEEKLDIAFVFVFKFVSDGRSGTTHSQSPSHSMGLLRGTWTASGGWPLPQCLWMLSNVRNKNYCANCE